MKNRWKALCAICLLVIPLFLGIMGVTRVDAAETVSITLNKRAVPSNIGEIQNTGENMDIFDSLAPLAGAGFTAFNITKEFYDTLNANGEETSEEYKEKLKATMQEIAEKYPDDQALPTEGQMGPEITTGDNGKAVFTNLAGYADGRHQVYLFVETTTPEGATKAQSLVVVLPITKANSEEENTDIQLYPKNVTSEGFEKGLNDEVEGKMTYDYEIGQEIGYYIDFYIPLDISEMLSDGTTKYKGLKINDRMDKKGTSIKGIYQVTVGDAAENLYSEFSKHWTVAYENQVGAEEKEGVSGFDLTFDFTSANTKQTIEFLGKYAGKKIRLSYTVIINEEAVPSIVMKNQANLELNNNGTLIIKEDEAPEIVTGGKQFVKVDMSNTSATLEGAEFVVKNKENPMQYAQFVQKTNTSPASIVWGSKEDATTLISTKDGKIEVRGLSFGDYVLEETKAPSGFVIHEKDTEFTIALNSWGDEAEIKQIANKPEGGLPATGGNGIYLFLLIGSTLMVGAYVWYKRSKNVA